MFSRSFLEVLKPNEINKCEKLYCREGTCKTNKYCDPEICKKDLLDLEKVFEVKDRGEIALCIIKSMFKIHQAYKLIVDNPFKSTEDKIFYGIGIIGNVVQLALDICDFVGISCIVPKPLLIGMKSILIFRDTCLPWLFLLLGLIPKEDKSKKENAKNFIQSLVNIIVKLMK